MKLHEVRELVSYFFGVRRMKVATRLWLKQYRAFRKAGRGRRWSADWATKLTLSILRLDRVVRP